MPVRDPGARSRAIANRLLDLALPASCAGCHREGRPLCGTCRPSLDVRLNRPPGTPLGLPSDVPAPLLQLEWCAPYEGAVRHALRQLKYGGERRLIGPLGQALAARWRVAGAGGNLVVPVPVHASRARERGFDQAELLAEAAAANLGLPMLRAVQRDRATVAQFQLNRGARWVNVRGAFRVRVAVASQVEGRWAILIDDVVTTGSTLAECATVLMSAGAAGVSALTVARER